MRFLFGVIWGVGRAPGGRQPLRDCGAEWEMDKSVELFVHLVFKSLYIRMDIPLGPPLFAWPFLAAAPVAGGGWWQWGSRSAELITPGCFMCCAAVPRGPWVLWPVVPGGRCLCCGAPLPGLGIILFVYLISHVPSHTISDRGHHVLAVHSSINI